MALALLQVHEAGINAMKYFYVLFLCFFHAYAFGEKESSAFPVRAEDTHYEETAAAIELGPLRITYFDFAQKFARRGIIGGTSKKLESICANDDLKALIQEDITELVRAAIGVERGVCQTEDFELELEQARKMILWQNCGGKHKISAKLLSLAETGDVVLKLKSDDRGFDEMTELVLALNTGDIPPNSEFDLTMDGELLKLLYEAIDRRSLADVSAKTPLDGFLPNLEDIEERSLVSWRCGEEAGRFTAGEFVYDFNGMPFRKSRYSAGEVPGLVYETFLSRRYYFNALQKGMDRRPGISMACDNYMRTYAAKKFQESLREQTGEIDEEALRDYFENNRNRFLIPLEIRVIRHEVVTSQPNEAGLIRVAVAQKNHRIIPERLRDLHQSSPDVLTSSHPAFDFLIEGEPGKVTPAEKDGMIFVFYEKVEASGNREPEYEQVRHRVFQVLANERYDQALEELEGAYLRDHPLRLDPRMEETICSGWFRRIQTGRF